MRHLRISGQNIKNLSSFKSQIGVIFQQLNKFEESDKNEALSYLRSCINNEPNTSKSNDKIGASRKRKRKTKRTIKRKSKREIKYCSKRVISIKKIIYKCKVCNATERTKRDMLKHVQTHVGSPLSCIKCRRTFNGSIPFNWHLTYYCRSAFYDKWKYKCDQCPREFMSKRNLDCHLQGHKRNNCTYCDKVLTKRVQLIKHLLEVHSVKLERDMYKCSFCEKRYIKKCSLYYHLQQHVPDKFVCFECGEISDSVENSDEHKRQHDLKKHFTCKKCGQKFSRRQQYLFHLKRHNMYRCLTCDESYASREKVTRHKQKGHQVEGLSPRFICPHCPLAFHRESRLFIHMRKHSEENGRSINCKYCKKTFISPYSYYKHCLTISHEKFSPEVSDIACGKCGKHFTKKYDLRQHMYRVHNETRKIVQCQYCNYKTTHKSNMERHISLHFRKDQRYTCEHCGKTCSNIASLKDHIAYNHIQERQFRCERCDKSFKRNSELVRHQDSHSNERPHVCTLCGKSYKRINHLRRHEKSAHEVVKKTRRIKPVDDESPSKDEPFQSASSSKVLFAQNLNDNVFADTNEGNIVEQLSSYLPEKGWGIDNEEFYNVYNDVALNYSNIQENEILINESSINEKE